MATDPLRLPWAVGVNLTLIVQLAPAARVTVTPQVPSPAGEKSPLNVKALKPSVPPPVFVTVTNRTALEIPTTASPKSRKVGERPIAGAAVPETYSYAPMS